MRFVWAIAGAIVLALAAAAQELPQSVELLQRLDQLYPWCGCALLAVDSQGNIYMAGGIIRGVSGANVSGATVSGTSGAGNTALAEPTPKIGSIPPACPGGVPDPIPDIVTIRSGPMGCSDLVVLKLDPSGQRIIYGTAVGGTKDDGAASIKVDGGGNVYILGLTASDDFPATSFQGKRTGFFVLKLNSLGEVVYNTVLGWADLVNAIGFDATGATYVGGTVRSGQLPVSASAYRSIPKSPPASEGFLAKLSLDGKDLQVATYMDSYPISNIQTRRGGDVVVLSGQVVTGLDSALSRLTFATPIDVSLGGRITSMSVDGSDNIYAVDTEVVRKYAPDGQRLLWAHDFQSGLFTFSATTSSGMTYLLGLVPQNFPTFNGTQPCMSNLQQLSLPAQNNLMAVVGANGDVRYATYIAARPDSQPVVSLKDDRLYLFADQNLYAGINWYGILRLNPADLPGVHTSAGCLVHSATLQPSDLAPGTIMTLFGDHMGPVTGASFTVQQGRAPFELAGASITVDGTPAPVLYAQDNQVNFVTPWSLRTDGARVPICVSRNQQSSCVYASTVPIAPGFFRIAPPQIAAINQDETINSPSHPAPAGSYVSLYLTGAGPLTGSTIDGGIAGFELQRLTTPVSGSFSFNPACFPGCQQFRADAEVLFAGAVPTLVYGATVVIVRVPEHPTSDSQASFGLRMLGQIIGGELSVVP